MAALSQSNEYLNSVVIIMFLLTIEEVFCGRISMIR